MFEEIDQATNAGKIVGITFSCFDLLHPGHCLMLQECKGFCDYLVVGLQTDPTIDRPSKNRPVQTYFERWVQLSYNCYVDFIIPYETENDVVNILTIVKPEIRIIGSDYEGKDFTGKEECMKHQIKICYNSRDHNFSTTELRRRLSK